MPLMVKKGIRGRVCHAIHWYAKANNKYMKDCDKNKKLSYLKFWNANNFYVRAMLKKLPVNGFEWVEDICEFNGYIIKSYNDEGDAEYFLEVDAQYLEKIHELHIDLPFLPERIKI